MSIRTQLLLVAVSCLLMSSVEANAHNGKALVRGPWQSVWVKKGSKVKGLLRVRAGKGVQLGTLAQPHRTINNRAVVLRSAPTKAVHIIPEGSPIVALPAGARMAVKLERGEKVVYNRGTSLVGITKPITMDIKGQPNGRVAGLSVFAIFELNDGLPLITVKGKDGKTRRFKPDVAAPIYHYQMPRYDQ